MLSGMNSSNYGKGFSQLANNLKEKLNPDGSYTLPNGTGGSKADQKALAKNDSASRLSASSKDSEYSQNSFTNPGEGLTA